MLLRPQISAEPHDPPSRLADSQIVRLVRQQILMRLDTGVYLLGLGEPTWSQRAWAAHLMGGRGSRLLGRSARVAYGLCVEELPIHLGGAVDQRTRLATVAARHPQVARVTARGSTKFAAAHAGR